MKYPIALSIIIGFIIFTAMYGWVNRYQFNTYTYTEVTFIERYNVFTDHRCLLFPGYNEDSENFGQMLDAGLSNWCD